MSRTRGGFETPVIGNGNFQFAPSGASWSFANGGGITGMNSGFTGVPSAAPQGVQVAFLQSSGEASQSISGFQAGTDYVITFNAIQRTNCCNTVGQDIRVFVDSTQIGTIHPGSSSYAEYSFPFTTTAGAHTIKFVGSNQTGDTAFIDNVRITGSPKPGHGVQWLVTDHLGTPRMALDETGSLANVKRHDYLPFGEELMSPGLRSPSLGYASGDGVRQQFTQKERDVETGLDYFGARYYASTQGRFISADGFWKDSHVADPQSWNKYAYVRNNPLKYIDPEGEKATVKIQTDEKNKTGTITITASVAIWTQENSGLTQDDLKDAAFFIEKDIEEAWSGTYVQDGITYTVTTDVQVTVAKDRDEAFGAGKQNVIEIWNGPIAHDADSQVNRASLRGGPDTGQWNLGKGVNDKGIIGAVAKHEFTHLLGVGNRDGGSYLSSIPYLSNPRPADTATAYDFGWALGGVINKHRRESQTPAYRGRFYGPQWRPRTSHFSEHTLGAPTRFGWWR